jgi:hypothetical protein
MPCRFFTALGTFGCDIDFITVTFQCLPYADLAVPIDDGGVNEVDSKFKGSMHYLDSLIKWESLDGDAAETEFRYNEPSSTKFHCFQSGHHDTLITLDRARNGLHTGNWNYVLKTHQESEDDLRLCQHTPSEWLHSQEADVMFHREAREFLTLL